MTTPFTIISLLFLLLQIHTISSFQTSTPLLPLRIDPISKNEITQRLGLKQITDTNNNEREAALLSIGSGPNMSYNLLNEHEVICPVSGSHQGILCTALLSQPIPKDDVNNPDCIANNHELVSQAILSGSLAASIRSQCPGNSMYYLPYIVTLVESYMADELSNFDMGDTVLFNSDGLETNEILYDLSSESELSHEEKGRSVMLYACNTLVDSSTATSDVYLMPNDNNNGKRRGKNNKIWKFSVEYKVASINLSQIASFGNRDSATPLRPDVWLKDDYY